MSYEAVRRGENVVASTTVCLQVALAVLDVHAEAEVEGKTFGGLEPIQGVDPQILPSETEAPASVPRNHWSPGWSSISRVAASKSVTKKVWLPG